LHPADSLAPALLASLLVIGGAMCIADAWLCWRSRRKARR
jgi:hypothetical protein